MKEFWTKNPTVPRPMKKHLISIDLGLLYFSVLRVKAVIFCVFVSPNIQCLQFSNKGMVEKLISEVK